MRRCQLKQSEWNCVFPEEIGKNTQKHFPLIDLGLGCFREPLSGKCAHSVCFSVHTEPGLLLGPRSVISSLAINWRTLWRHPDCPWLSFFLSSLLFLFFFLFFPSFLKICLFKGESCTEREMRRGRERKKERGRKEGKEEDWIFCLQVHSLDGYSSQGWARLKPKAPNSWSATRVEETQGLEVWSASSQGMW